MDYQDKLDTCIQQLQLICTTYQQRIPGKSNETTKAQSQELHRALESLKQSYSQDTDAGNFHRRMSAIAMLVQVHQARLDCEQKANHQTSSTFRKLFGFSSTGNYKSELDKQLAKMRKNGYLTIPLGQCPKISGTMKETIHRFRNEYLVQVALGTEGPVYADRVEHERMRLCEMLGQASAGLKDHAHDGSDSDDRSPIELLEEFAVTAFQFNQNLVIDKAPRHRDNALTFTNWSLGGLAVGMFIGGGLTTLAGMLIGYMREDGPDKYEVFMKHWAQEMAYLATQQAGKLLVADAHDESLGASAASGAQASKRAILV